MNIVYYCGDWVEDKIGFAPNDRIQRGDGVFDTMLVIVEDKKARLIHPERHFERLQANAHLMEIVPRPTPNEFETIASELCERNTLEDGRYALNTLITRGSGPRGLMPPTESETEPTIVMRLSEAPKQSAPIEAIICRRTVRNERSPLSQIKSCNYGDNILALIEARHKGANEAILLNNLGNIACATSGNLFVVIGGILYTPPLSDGVLDGITRQLIIEKYGVMQSSITLQDLMKSDGAYITNSIKGCVPIKSLNGKDMPEPSIKIEKDFFLK